MYNSFEVIPLNHLEVAEELLSGYSHVFYSFLKDGNEMYVTEFKAIIFRNITKK
ncbi:MAG: hypothetical protein Ta2E_00830 [Mycoplasmoidaceae bacterium]|nr:MAG: hypothetical protein Ta2E_00830 [Mycoplasmoidaceae bacterium]